MGVTPTPSPPDPRDHRPRKRLHPLELGALIAEIPETNKVPSPVICWENGRLTVTWRHPAGRREFRVVVDPGVLCVERVRPRATTAYIVARNPIKFIRDGIDWLITGEEEWPS